MAGREKGSTRFTTCNQMQMGPWSLSEGSLYDIDFFEMLPAAARFCGDDSVFSRPGRVAPADQGKALSFKPGAAVRHNWFLLTETLPCLLVCV